MSFAGGFVAGIAVPCLPFEILAPSGFGRTVFVSELVQATHGRVGASPRLADITGIVGLPSVRADPHLWQGFTAAAVLLLFVAIAWLRGSRAGFRATALDWFALVTTIVVVAMLFSPSEWYVHYAAFAGPFLVVLIGLSAGQLYPRPAWARTAGEETDPDPHGPDRRGVRGLRHRRPGGGRRAHRDHAGPGQAPESGERRSSRPARAS